MGGSARSSLDPSELNACAKEGRESAAARSLVAGGMLAQQSVHSDGFRSRQSWTEEGVVARRRRQRRRETMHTQLGSAGQRGGGLGVLGGRRRNASRRRVCAINPDFRIRSQLPVVIRTHAEDA